MKSSVAMSRASCGTISEPASGHVVSRIETSNSSTITTAAMAAGPPLALEDESVGTRLGLRDHDREEDEHADGADVDEHLGARP